MADTGGDRFYGPDTFYGGESQDSKFGSSVRSGGRRFLIQYNYGRHIDVRANARGFSVLPGMAKTTGGTVTDLVLGMVQVPSGIRYAVGSAGNIYRITAAGVWSNIGNIGENSGGGILYRSDMDAIYLTGQTKVARISLVSTTPTLQVDWFKYGISTATSCYKTGGTNTYTLPTSIQENATNMRTFVADIEPLYRLGVKPVTATGNWTLTLHDDANNNLGSVTVNAASLTVNQINYFVLGAVRLMVSANNYTSSSSGGRTYHFHLTSTVTTDTVQTTTAGSLADADMELWATALVPTNNGLHPIYQFASFTLFGNEKYVAAYQPLQDNPTTADFLRHRIQFPPGYETNGIAQLDLYAGITAEKRSTSATQDYQEGKMFLWDGIQTTYNRYYDVPEGSPEGVFSHKNVLYFIANGALYESSGGQPVKIRTIRGTESTYSNTADSTHIYPNVMTVRRNILLIGYPSFTTNQSLEHAIYGFGQASNQFPLSWTTSYSISTGTRFNSGSNNLRIGMVKNFGDTLYLSWRDDSTGTVQYGVDLVNNSSAPASDFEISLLYFDAYVSYKEKLAKKALSVWPTLPAGTSITMKHKVNGEANWHYATDDGTAATTGGSVAQQNISKQFIGIEVGLDGTTTAATSPFCSTIQFIYDPEPDRSELSA